MRVRNLDTKGNTLAAAFTFSHGTCTSCSEVRNQNNQLDYCSRLPGKMQAFFQKILRFFGKPNSFSHRCAMPAVPLLALCATSPGRGSLSQRRSLWRKGQAFSFAKGPISEGAVCEADWGRVHLRIMLQCALPLAQKRQMRYTINTTTAPVFR